MNSLRTVYYVQVNWFGQVAFVFDADINLLRCWGCCDATYSHTYLDKMMEALGIVVVQADKNDERFKQKIQDELRKHGATDEDFADE